MRGEEAAACWRGGDGGRRRPERAGARRTARSSRRCWARAIWPRGCASGRNRQGGGAGVGRRRDRRLGPDAPRGRCGGGWRPPAAAGSPPWRTAPPRWATAGPNDLPGGVEAAVETDRAGEARFASETGPPGLIPGRDDGDPDRAGWVRVLLHRRRFAKGRPEHWWRTCKIRPTSPPAAESVPVVGEKAKANPEIYR